MITVAGRQTRQENIVPSWADFFDSATGGMNITSSSD